MRQRTLATATLVAFAFALSPLHAEPERPNRAESDDPNARRKAMREWYEGDWSPSYKRFMNQAAARERARYAEQLPEAGGTTAGAAVTGTEPLAASTPGTWANIGPTSSSYIENGSTKLNEIDSGRPVEIVIDPSTGSQTAYVAMSGGGVWKTTDGGATWAPKTESLGSLSCGALEMDPANASVLYLGLGDAFDGTGIGFTKSTDGGETWSDPVYLGASTIINKIQAAGGGVLLAATDKGLFRSTDGGAAWSAVAVATGFAETPYGWDIAHLGGTTWVASVEATPSVTSGTTNGQVWRTTDNGVTWTKAAGVAKAAGVGRISLAAAADGSVVYAMAAVPNASTASDLSDFFTSTDGLSWTPLNATASTVSYTNTNTESSKPITVMNGQGWYDHMLIVDRTNPNSFYFGGALLMARATKQASGAWQYTQLTNWLAQFGLPYLHADFHAAAFGNDGTLWVGSDGGVFQYNTTGIGTWKTRNLNSGITSHLIYSVGSSPNAPNAVIGGFQDNGTRVREADTGSYNQELGGDGFGSVVNRANGQHMLGTLYYSRVYKSTNGGLTFSSACTGIRECNNSSSAPFYTKLTPWTGDATGNTVFTHSNTKVYKTTNFAGSWSALGSRGLARDAVLRNVGVAKSNVNHVGAVASGGRVYLSSNGGTNFTQRIPPNNGLSLSSVSFDPANPNIVYVTSVAPDATKNHVWKSTDFGASWTAIENGLPAGVPVNIVVPDPDNGSTLYAGTHLGVYVSTNAGGTWTRFGNGLPLVNATDIYVSPTDSLVRVSTFGRGFWEIR
jgi:hypothetical protein